MSKWCGAVVLLLTLPAVARCQSQAQAEAFEAISIGRAHAAPGSLSLRVLANGDLDARAVPVLLLVQYAYDLPFNPSSRLSGAVDSRDTYDVEAKAPANAMPAGLSASERRDRTKRMMRGLLVDRFKLVMRVDQKSMPVYALTVARGGPNLQKSTITEKNCLFDMRTPERCHGFLAGRGHPLIAKAIDMDDLVRYIENWTDMPVVNRTALSGLFAVESEGWRPMKLPPRPPGSPQIPNFDDLPTIFTVLQKLGLELKRTEANVPIYTVESMEHPRANEDKDDDEDDDADAAR